MVRIRSGIPPYRSWLWDHRRFHTLQSRHCRVGQFRVESGVVADREQVLAAHIDIDAAHPGPAQYILRYAVGQG